MKGERSDSPYRIDLISRIIPLKLLLDVVPGSSADVTGLLCGCFVGIDENEYVKYETKFKKM